MNKEEAFTKLKPLLVSMSDGIAKQFGPNCEVAVHNLTKGYNSTIELLVNGHVSGRKVGDSASETVLEALKDKDIADRYGYITHTKDGRMLKSSTINVRDEAGDVIAVVSLNYDISEFAVANKIITDFLNIEGQKPEDTGELITNDVSVLLETMIEEARNKIGKPVSAMTKEDKMEVIRYLDKKGALLIKKSSERISEYLGISKYTLYKYLGDGQAEDATSV
ncbi:MAG: helix-turn-helix transcriptional regulator [Clostridiales Family XIII bacterium]|jgi:predicted transcriptional regulator YheO|nr:helix-turn-helix transcriptional regulator [Clostridiales Family XIII bacterium]